MVSSFFLFFLSKLKESFIDCPFFTGRGSNTRKACAAMKDMLLFLDTKNLPQAKIYFSHSQMLFLLLTALHTADDSDSLRADNYYSMLHRKFRSSDL